jgi:hypothetical protein
MAKSSYLPPITLLDYFIPTADTCGEWRKARIKNANLPVLQYMYNGDETDSLRCMISKTRGWVVIPDYGTEELKIRFRLDFNHVRQKCSTARQAGTSVDKSERGPSDIFRGWYLSPKNAQEGTFKDFERKANLIEFLTIMPVCTEHHSYISQDSAKSDLTLKNFSKDTWIWALQSPDNFNKAKEKLRFNLDYDWFIDHMSNINYPNIRDRLVELNFNY